MLATTLKTEIATRVSIKIMRTFVALRKFVSNDLIEQKYINNLVLKDSRRIDLIEETLSNFKEKNNHIFFEGQIYDAYSVMLDILNTSKNSIMIIDNYIDKNILDILSKTNKKYSKKLTSELGKGYSITSLKYMRQFYLFAKSQPLVDQSISWSHYTILMTLDNQNEINYYI